MAFRDEQSSPTAVLGDDLIRVVKLLHVARQHAPRQHPKVDPMAYPLLFQLKVMPLRLTELAGLLHTDVSTVSRQMSVLVDLGFVSRGPDPDDGRAQVLSLTPQGESLLRSIRASRDRWLQGLLTDWSTEEIHAFSAHLQHLASDLEAGIATTSRRTER